MGISDRDYVNSSRGMGGPPGGGQGRLFARSPDWSVTTWLIVINVAIYLLSFMVPFVMSSGYLTLNKVASLEVWRLITFQFLHADFMHVLFNMFAIYMFGAYAERFWRSRPDA